MNIQLDTKNDLLYLPFESAPTTILNCLSENTLNIGQKDKVIRKEIMYASNHVNPGKIFRWNI